MTAIYHVGDVLAVLKTLPEDSVDLVMSSPPFLALRSYLPADHPDKMLEGGSQATPGEYIDWLVDVVEACDRVLAPHGSLVFELGDTYAGSGGAGGDYDRSEQDRWVGSTAWKSSADGAQRHGKKNLREGQPKFSAPNVRKAWIVDHDSGRRTPAPGWPLAKSLTLIPELFRFTLVYGFNPLTGRHTERWRLRNVIRWVRPNPPVGALGDKFRPATSELMVLCKSGKRFFDLDAVREPYSERFERQIDRGEKRGPMMGAGPEVAMTRFPKGMSSEHSGAPPLDWWNIPLDGGEPTPYGPKAPSREVRTVGGASASKGVSGGDSGNPDKERPSHNPAGAPPLDWWNIPPGGYAGAHYAVFPPELCIKPIKAMCPEQVCRTCGEPRRRIVDYDRMTTGGDIDYDIATGRTGGTRRMKSSQGETAVHIKRETLGFSDCGHNDYRSGMVLDPFAGTGTTALVATGHGRDCILIDLDERNWDLALERVGPLILERAS